MFKENIWFLIKISVILISVIGVAITCYFGYKTNTKESWKEKEHTQENDIACVAKRGDE